MSAIAGAGLGFRAIRQRITEGALVGLHLFMYLALAISFLRTSSVLGPSFVGHR